MEIFIEDSGFSVCTVVADNSDYVEDQSKGKNAHFFRVRMDNFLASIDEEKLLFLYEIFGSMGVGRDLTYYCHRI